MLYIFSGLPGVGKSTIARMLTLKTKAFYLRIDSIEQSLKENGINQIDDKGYVIAYKIALDNLRLGLDVVADSVNPIKITRNAWHEVAKQANTSFCDIEVICSDSKVHKKRVETRQTDIVGLKLPNWNDVVNREYEDWGESKRVVLDTSENDVSKTFGILIERLL